MGEFVVILAAAAFVISCGSHVQSVASDHRYKAGDLIPCYVSRTGPLYNPSEIYGYYDLPFCRPGFVNEKKQTLRDILAGHQFFNAPYKLEFLVNKDSEVVCEKNLTKEEVSKFQDAEHLIEISAQTNPSSCVEVTEEREVHMKLKYTVTWKETSSPFEERMQKSFHNKKLADNIDQTGWKFIHGDVFRYPYHKSLFAAAIGSGTQLFTLTILVLVLGTAGAFHPYEQGYLFIALLVIYALTSAVAGYTSAYFYGQLEGTEWVSNLLLTGLLFCGPLFARFCILNKVAIVYKATAAFPSSTIVFIFLIWMLVALPSLIVGGIAGKNCKAHFQAPCRTTKCPKPIPPLRWYRGCVPQMLLAGFLPFGVILNELHHIYDSSWGHNIYSSYGFLCLLFTLLLITTALVTVVLTYFQLAAEDYRWWWRQPLQLLRSSHSSVLDQLDYTFMAIA
ncbi:unnamed protein product [Dovyalis caffra]|uniref:Transmembrane 9 superfamily member n=1 Tax=Dovyalis caffra TaxID=77055 RepID=A0AAV1R0G9_9ROSI|nr:unnamed protein product [Dovyalis caffra]